MATFYLINTTTVGTQKFFAGNLIDDTVQPAALITAAGGVLWPAADTIVAAAAAAVQASRRAKAINEADADGRMDAAVASSIRTRDHETKGADLTDASPTITLAQGKWRVMPAATMSAGRTITLDPAGCVAGDQLEVTRLDASANTLAFINGGPGAGTLLTMPVSKVNFAKFQFDGTNWALKECGTQ